MISIAIVEDQSFIAHTIASIIEESNQGYQVCGIFPNGQKCLEQLDALRPQLILSDIRMPIMDGLTLAQTVMAQYPNIKIILLTGYEDFQYAKQALQLGVVDYLLKPANPQELLAALQKASSQLVREQGIRDTLDEYYTLIENLPTLKQQALISILFHYASLRQADFEQLRLTPFLGPLVFCAVEIMQETVSGFAPTDAELMLYGCCNILTELFTAHESHESHNSKEIFICNRKIFLLLPFPSALPSENEATEMIQAALDTTAHYLGFQLRIETLQTVPDIFSVRLAPEAPATDSAIPGKHDASEIGSAEGKILSAKDSVLAAIAYIQSNFQQDLSLQDVADHIFLSYNYLSRVFSQQLGMSFSAYLTKTRIEKACELLRVPQLRVSQIAENVGYCNYRYFTQVFKKLTDYTPGDYRKLYCSDYYGAGQEEDYSV